MRAVFWCRYYSLAGQCPRNRFSLWTQVILDLADYESVTFAKDFQNASWYPLQNCCLIPPDFILLGMQIPAAENHSTSNILGKSLSFFSRSAISVDIANLLVMMNSSMDPNTIVLTPASFSLSFADRRSFKPETSKYPIWVVSPPCFSSSCFIQPGSLSPIARRIPLLASGLSPICLVEMRDVISNKKEFTISSLSPYTRVKCPKGIYGYQSHWSSVLSI